MKYVSHQPLGQSPHVVWTGFSIPVQSSHGAAKLAEELNRLDTDLVRTRQELEAIKRDLTLQVEAKNNYISQAATFVTAIRESQKILAEYIDPSAVPLGPKAERAHIRHALTELLGVLDHRDLVALVQGSSLSEEHIRKGSIKTAVEMSTLNDWENATHQITFDGKHWVNVELDVDCFTACSDGKRSWSVDSIPSANVVQRPTTEADIDYEVSPAILERVVNNTTNHFAPEPKASKKQLRELKKAVKYFEEYADEKDPLNENVKAAKHLRKLLKKLS